MPLRKRYEGDSLSQAACPASALRLGQPRRPCAKGEERPMVAPRRMPQAAPNSRRPTRRLRNRTKYTK
jgi:hypothetical protein